MINVNDEKCLSCGPNELFQNGWCVPNILPCPQDYTRDDQGVCIPPSVAPSDCSLIKQI